jgi:hypothetical protein
MYHMFTELYDKYALAAFLFGLITIAASVRYIVRYRTIHQKVVRISGFGGMSSMFATAYYQRNLRGQVRAYIDYGGRGKKRIPVSLYNTLPLHMGKESPVVMIDGIR